MLPLPSPSVAARTVVALLAVAAGLAAQEPRPEPTVTTAPADDEKGFIPLFNGEDLTGWTPKIRGHAAGVNFADTFRVEDGVLKVRYDGYEGPFDGRFGHLFHETEWSSYVLRLEYRFVGEQIDGGPGWAFRNSGIMVHGQSPQSMRVDQDFPVSIEVQLLGGNGKDERPTANLCTPGTNVVLDGQLERRHCTNSRSKTWHGDQWVAVEVEVRGSEVIRHRIGGKVVLEYTQPQLDERDGDAAKIIEARHGEKLLSGGTISLQSESHPCEFRNIRIKPLSVPAADRGGKDRDSGDGKDTGRDTGTGTGSGNAEDTVR